jgi:hypothetical protein
METGHPAVREAVFSPRQRFYLLNHTLVGDVQNLGCAVELDSLQKLRVVAGELGD